MVQTVSQRYCSIQGGSIKVSNSGDSMKFLVTLETDEDGWLVAECPGLPGCVSQGYTREEALANIREAIVASLETRRALGLPTGIQVAEVEVSSAA
ncbi:MAG TPA: type II toxin-antitoxin system HicB family antitoxin [Candidatus Binataceae bacterium]|nr:type II toxin-antitoxin system HicB family antitoxin [Candidatus Binataceae bacterium]